MMARVALDNCPAPVAVRRGGNLSWGQKGMLEVGRLPIEESAIRGRFSAVICLFKFSGSPTSHRTALVSRLRRKSRLSDYRNM